MCDSLGRSADVLQVLFASTLSRARLRGTEIFPLPSGLRDLLPLTMAFEYSLMSLYSGFLYQVRNEGNLIAMVL